MYTYYLDKPKRTESDFKLRQIYRKNMRRAEARQRLKQNILILVTAILTVSALLYISISFIKYPEKYLTTWKYQLKNAIVSGDAEAIDYYNSVYLANGVKLFED